MADDPPMPHRAVMESLERALMIAKQRRRYRLLIAVLGVLAIGALVVAVTRW